MNRTNDGIIIKMQKKLVRHKWMGHTVDTSTKKKKKKKNHTKEGNHDEDSNNVST